MRIEVATMGLGLLLAIPLHAQTTKPSPERYRLPEYAWHDATPLSVPEWRVSGTAKLTVVEPRVQSGQQAHLRLEFTNTGREWSFYNPFLAIRLPEPVWIVSYDPETRKQIALSDPWDGRSGFIAPRPTDWVRMPTGASVAVSFDIWVLRGKQLVQIVYLSRFIRPPKETFLPDDLPDNPESLQKEELFRSNAVAVEGIGAAAPK